MLHWPLNFIYYHGLPIELNEAFPMATELNFVALNWPSNGFCPWLCLSGKMTTVKILYMVRDLHTWVPNRDLHTWVPNHQISSYPYEIKKFFLQINSKIPPPSHHHYPNIKPNPLTPFFTATSSLRPSPLI